MKKSVDFIGVGTGPFNLSIAALSHQIEELDCLFFDGTDIKGLEAVDQCHRHYGTAGVYSTFKGTCFKFQELIPLSGSGPLWKNQIISPFPDLFCHLIDHL